MAGSISLLGDLDLSESEIPGMGEIRDLKIRNTGTTKVELITVEVEGKGARNVILSSSRRSWDESRHSIKLDGIPSSGEVVFYARAVYHVDDAEDKQEFNLVVRAMSVG